MAAVQNLNVYVEIENSDEMELISTTSVRYQIVEAVTNLGLGILESPQGRASLVQVATEIIQQRNNPPGKKKKEPIAHIYDQPLGDMPHWIDIFLQKLRENFPSVFLLDTPGEAVACRQDWKGTDMKKYDPKVAGTLQLNQTIIKNMAHVRGQPPNVAGDNYNRFKFQMAITVAHEMCHLLTGFLSGSARPPTPPGVSLDNYGDRLKGEAGRYWESILLGGVVEFWEDKNDPLKARQAGMPYIMEDSRSSVPARAVSPTYIHNFLNGHFSFPIATSRGTSTTRSALRKISTEMTMVRQKAMRRMPAYSSPEPQGNAAYRRLPPTHHSYSGSQPGSHSGSYSGSHSGSRSGSHSTYYAHGSSQVQPSNSHAQAYGSTYGSHSAGYENGYSGHSSGYGYRR
ncbi:hypothetical protein F4821DRAFT_239949 [Hypoxylon rubiginosum]|uniref:Uncharacterized protein n=1 Tax=Hypoxylon rubiginosum TaxID=110542 RepID=A0ACC0CZC3_9PEZI|nr:hypothetical protein F4821DRAFT_239949 [Hypoxylon rubiginosum]